MQTIRRVAAAVMHLAWQILVPEGALLLAIAIVWRWTRWHTTDSYGAALSTAGGVITGLGIFVLATGRGSNDMKLSEAEMDMRSWDRKGQRRFISPYTEGLRMWTWLIVLGIVTVGMGILFNIFRL